MFSISSIVENGLNYEILYSGSVRNLGLVMNIMLKWNDHSCSVPSRKYGGLRSLWLNKSITPLSTRLLFVRSWLIPHFAYCGRVYSCSLDCEPKRIIAKSFNSCDRDYHNDDLYWDQNMNFNNTTTTTSETTTYKIMNTDNANATDQTSSGIDLKAGGLSPDEFSDPLSNGDETDSELDNMLIEQCSIKSKQHAVKVSKNI